MSIGKSSLCHKTLQFRNNTTPHTNVWGSYFSVYKTIKPLYTGGNSAFYNLKNLNIMTDVKQFKLNDGSWLTQDFGKYRTGLLIIHSDDIQWDNNISAQDLNIGGGSISFIRGTYFKTKKGADAFKVDPNGPHKLLRDSWGGCFNSNRGYNLPVDGGPDVLYCRRARSNGGGCGNDYVIVDKDWKKSLSIDDL